MAADDRPVMGGLARRLRRVARRVRSALRGRGDLPVFHDPRFRIPIPSMNARHGVEVRRADFAVWYLTIGGWIAPSGVRTPDAVSYSELALVHTDALLHGLTTGERLAQVFQADPAEVRVGEVMRSIRLACGATLQGARLALHEGGPVLSTLGGFHHAFPDKAGGLCPVNDIAVAIAVLRSEGVEGTIGVLDLDAHPPDGTAACLIDMPDTWIGSLSGSDWGPVPGADETVLPTGADDTTYLAALRALLARMPPCRLVFVIAGGDVLDGDRFGNLGMSLEGVRRRDLTVHHALRRVASVWLPGGGYSSQSWRVLAGTGLVLAGHGTVPIPDTAAPEDLRFDRIARMLDPDRLGNPAASDDWLGAAELERELGMRPSAPVRLLDTYTEEGLRYAFEAYGVLQRVAQLGYGSFRIGIDRMSMGERLRLWGRDDRYEEHLLVEAVVEKRELAGHPVLFIHWLTLRHPTSTFGPARPRLPGQEVPGLGLSLEAVELIERASRRIEAEGVAMVPSYLHTAWPPGPHVAFVDDARQGRYEALLRDLGHLPRQVLSQALEDGRVRLNGEPYVWEATEMVYWSASRPSSEDVVRASREASRFTLADRDDDAPSS